MIKKIKKDNKGFSLVELIIAIAVLAMLSLPLLSYFTGAAMNASKGSFLQEGEMAAQSIIEEIHSYDTYEQLEQAVAAARCPFYTDAPDEGAKKFLSRDILVDGKNLIAKVTIDFDYDSTGSSVAYNNFEVPELKALYSDKNAVAVENNETEMAVNEFYYQYFESKTKGQIQNALNRKTVIDVKRNATDDSLIDISVVYHYRYNGETYEAPPVLKTQVLSAEFDSLYFLYDIYRSDVTDEMMEINMTGFTAGEAADIKYYFICQGTATGVTRPAGYKINVAGTGQYLQSFYYTNGVPANLPNTDIAYIKTEKRNRIANITVDIYNEGETVFNDSTRMVRIESAKGE